MIASGPRLPIEPLTDPDKCRLKSFVLHWKNNWLSKRIRKEEDEKEVAKLEQFTRSAREADQRVQFVPDQIPWDASVLLGLDRFRSWEDFVEHVLRHTPENFRIVVKLHPKRRSPVGYAGGSRILALDRINIHTLLGLCDSVCTFSSNVGFEALLRGVPVIAGGRPHFAHRGFTSDLCGAASDVERLSHPEFTDRQKEIFDRYAHHVIFDFLIDQDDAGALDRRMQEAMEKRGRQFHPRSPFAAAFPLFTREYSAGVALYNSRTATNGTHLELAAGLAEQFSTETRRRVSPKVDVDADSLISKCAMVNSVGEMDAVSHARYSLAATVIGGRVVDLGCGCGVGAYLIAQNGHTCVLAADASKCAIDFAKAKWLGVKFLHTTVMAFYSAIDQYFDGTICFGLLECVPDAGALLRKIGPRLALGGLLVATFPNSSFGTLERPEQESGISGNWKCARSSRKT